MKASHTKKIKILMPAVHYLPVLGGLEVFMKNFAERVGKHSEISVVTGKVKGAGKMKKKGYLTVHRSSSLYPLTDLSGTSYLYIITTLPFIFFKTLYFIWFKGYNIMHANGFFNGVVCLFAKFFTGVPYVITIQSADFNIYHPKANRMVTWVHDRLESWVYKGASAHHSVSEDLCDHFSRQGIDRSLCHMIPNGVETDLFYVLDEAEKIKVREEYDLPQDSFVVSNISRLEWKNGTHDLIEALSLIKDEYPKIKLLLIGDGSDRKRLEKLSEERGVADRVIFLGEVKYEKVGKILSSTDAFARTPLAEGFGIVFLEAMATGIPVIGTRTGGIVDFLKDGETGLVCDVGDVKDISLAMKRLHDDKVLSEKLIARANMMIKEKYEWDTIVSKVFSIFENIHEKS